MARSQVTRLLQLNKQSAADVKQTILAPFIAVKATSRDASAPLPHTYFFFIRNYMRVFGLWPTDAAVETPVYYACNLLIMMCTGIFVVTITCDLYDVADDFVLLGEDLVVALGLYLILLKILLFRYRSYDIDTIIAEFEMLHKRYSYSDKMLQHRRTFFLVEVGICTSSMFLGILLFAAMSVQPLLSQQLLPFRAKFPFGLADPEQHPYCYVGVYVFQCCCLIYMLTAIVMMDTIGGNAFNQTTVNLKVLCIRIRELAQTTGDDMNVANQNGRRDAILWKGLHDVVRFHQQLISLIDRINEAFYWNYVFQMGASTFMICFTAFEALLAQDQPMVALKFQMYMVAAFLQLLYWCYMGNMTTVESVEVAIAAVDIHAWYEQSPRFQRNLMFLLQRAQKPLEFRARPFFPFNYETFTSILSTSYSYFALLRTMND